MPLDRDDASVRQPVEVELRKGERLPMSALVKPPCPTCGHSATRVTVTLPYEYDAFRPEHIVIADPDDWHIDDILIHGRSQLACGSEGIPGYALTPDGLDSFVSFDTIQRRMEFALVVSYIGLNPIGGMFSAEVIGSAVMHQEAVA